jgi:rod shape-determining protein MreD
VSRHPNQVLQTHEWIGLPMLAAILATVALAAPVRLFGIPLPEPVFPMALAFAWAVIRPSILGPFALLLLGLFLDLFWGTPFGLWGLSLLVAYGVSMLIRPLIQGQSPQAAWVVYALVSLLGFAVAYGLAAAGARTAPTLLGAALQYAVTAALYPIVYWLTERFEDADVRFR